MSFLLEKFCFHKFSNNYDTNLKHLKYCHRNEYQIPFVYYTDLEYKYTLIIAHGNHEDISNYDVEYISKQYECNVCVFEYSGYGLHTCNESTEYNCNADIYQVYKYLTNELKVEPDKIILYGKSIGTGVVCDLACYLSLNKKPPAGLILISPLSSVVRVITNIWTPVDIFMNYKLAPKIDCYTLIFHGDMDDVVPYSCGVELSKLFPYLYNFVTLRGYGHNNISISTCTDQIKNFIRFLNRSPT